MPLQPVPFAQQSYLDPSRPVSVQRLVNMYLQPKQAQSKSRTALNVTPGLELVGTYGDGPCRGLIAMGEYVYMVSGNELYRVDESGLGSLAGAIAGLGHVAMAHNGATVVVAAAPSEVYYADATNYGLSTLSTICGLAFQDGYILAAERNSQKVFISGLNDAIAWPGDFTLVNALPDVNVGIVNLNREIWVFNERSIQIYYNSGAASFPFTRNPAGVIDIGCASGASIAERKGSVAWLGDDYRVYMNQGYAAVPISTPAIEQAIYGYASRDSAIGAIYTELGHTHYVLTFPNDATLVYDGLTGLWHERQSDERNDWRGRGLVDAFGSVYVGDAVNGNLYKLSRTTYTEDGATVRRLMTSPPIHGGKSRLFFGALEVDMDSGVGLEGNGQGSDPTAMLRWTDDGGRTYSNELWRSFGKSGDYKRRVRWTGLGSSRSRSFELSISDAVSSVVIEAYASVNGAWPA